MRTIAVSVFRGHEGLRVCRARQQFARRGSRLRRQHAVEDASSVLVVFGLVGIIDFGVDVVVGVDERDVLLNTTGPYPTFVPLLDATEPITISPSN
jgi:hypothetical protein